MASSYLTTLGGFAFSVDGVPTRSPATRKARALMAYLAMNPKIDVARERIVEVFWPDSEPQRARDSLSTALHSIRRCIRSGGLDADTYLLTNKSVLSWIGPTEVDAVTFAGLAARRGEQTDRDALAIYRGDFLEGDFDDWAVAERERLGGLYESVLARIVRTSNDAEVAKRFVTRNPYDEAAYVAIIDAELAAGRRASAASWAERCRLALAEVGEKPSGSFEARFEHVARVEPAFTAELSLPFAGRERELADLTARIDDAMAGKGSVTIVHGEAGIGKSTLIERIVRLSTERGVATLTVRAGAERANPFSLWHELLADSSPGGLDEFVRVHANDAVAAIAQAVVDRLGKHGMCVVDDAHDLAGESLDVFVAVVRQASASNALLIGSRPEGVAVLRARMADLDIRDLELGRLGREDLRVALAQTLGSEEPSIFEMLFDRSAGHPLFFAGLLNSLADSGVISRDDRRWRVVKPIGTDFELPDTLRRFIESRLRARGEMPRALACALALEPSATVDDIGAVLKMDESTTLDALDDLLSLGVIVQPSAGPLFAFAHDAIRDVAAAGFNAGRRIALHRAFARRLETSTVRDVGLRLARHLEAAGESLAAARVYTRSASAALDMHAVQDAVDRCDAGIREALRLERTPERDVALSELQRTAARAEIARGNAGDAVLRAREATTFAHTSGDARARALAALDLAAVEGAAGKSGEQSSDAAQALEIARSLGDGTLEARALLQLASAARDLGRQDEAIENARQARTTASQCGRADIEIAALSELLRAQTTWWFFTEACSTARVAFDAARRDMSDALPPLLEARAGLFYLLGRYDEARADIEAALADVRNDGLASRAAASPLHSRAFVEFECMLVLAKLACARDDWASALEALAQAAAVPNVARLRSCGNALSLIKIDVLLRRRGAGDDETASDEAATLDVLPARTNGTLGWSDCADLARARVAARRRSPNAAKELRRAVDLLEDNAHRALLDTDVAFDRLAEAAGEIGDDAVVSRARARARDYRAYRMARASAAAL
jgi:DNA-binding SARP family transcriptional activator/tetratricopeptide (TPR) repeat protein